MSASNLNDAGSPGDPSRPARGILASVGPGLLWAGAAIGVSHLVQSTRAGARSGFALLWAVIIANVFKYPFFEIGPRYAAATGESLIEGYRRLGRGALTLYLLFTVATMFPVQAAITIVTAGLAAQLFPSASLSPPLWAALLLGLCALVLSVGRYALLDGLIKVVIITLSISTLVAVAMAFSGPQAMQPGFTPPPIWDATGVSFLVGLMGWMPAPIDIAAWHSLWTLERRKQTGHAPSQREALFDYNVGFIGTALLALGFLSLGALVMHGSGERFPAGAIGFAGKLLELYTLSLGSWSRLLIGIAAFTTMFSTTITVLDAYPRVLQAILALRRASIGQTPQPDRRSYWGGMVLLVAGTLAILFLLISELKRLVDFATTMSFLVAPALAWINLAVIRGDNVPAAARQSPLLRGWSWAGMTFLLGFSALFVFWKLR
jgi:Mn2+/Fe2+ NRAMP family transporter